MRRYQLRPEIKEPNIADIEVDGNTAIFKKSKGAIKVKVRVPMVKERKGENENLNGIGKEKKKGIEYSCWVVVFAIVFCVGSIVTIAQIEANDVWINDCNKKYGEDGWERRDATSEERNNISHHIGSVPISYIGQISVCVPKEK